MIESCSLSNKKVKCHHKAICCDLFDKWIDFNNNELNDLDYEYLKFSENAWYCKIFTIERLPFCKPLKDSNKSNIDNKLSNKINVNLKNLLTNLNNPTNDEKDENNDLPNSKYKDQEHFSLVNNNMKSKYLSMLHLNISFL